MRHALVTAILVAAALGLLGQASEDTLSGADGSGSTRYVAMSADGGGGAGGNDDSGWGG
ncbi:hypothetical protein [Streptomyces sp. AHA2]|uniref:hypothetical protein n=1 Tax=Streptomyces sp. AHA2 TaxID=3064526 RepID=UPI002FE13859